MTLEHDLLQLARDAMRSLMTGRDFGTGQTGHYLNIIRRIEAELSRPKPELDPKPAAWMYRGHLHQFDPSDWATEPACPLYKIPPHKKWVGLTELERRNMFKDVDWDNEPWGYLAYARAIETTLKEKNT
jgi:hypothetical protein